MSSPAASASPAEPPETVVLTVRVDELLVIGKVPRGWCSWNEPLLIQGSPGRMRAVRILARPGYEIQRTDFRVVTVA